MASPLPLRHMKQKKAGHLINVSSVAGHKVTPAGAAYAATQYAVRALSEGLRQEIKPHNIRATVISPGAVATELPDSITEPEVADSIRKLRNTQFLPIHSRARSLSPSASQKTWA
jgi:NADP-dependent 3-hydroxy acid dehydrogenase YdfG